MTMIETALNNLTLVRLLILILGTYSITRLITTDTFPLFAFIRTRIYESFPHTGFQTRKRPVRGKWIAAGGGNYYVNEGTWFGDLVSCPWCAGFYVALAATSCYVLAPYVALIGCLVMGLRASTGILASYTH